MTDKLFSPGTATAIGSMPGTDAVEAARIVADELPVLTPMPELPARGVGADMVGRTAGMLRDLAVEVVPSGYRVARHSGRDQRRAIDFLRWDLDAIEVATAGDTDPRTVKVQAAGPWTLTAGIELQRGHRVLTDHGALRDFADSLCEGVIDHCARMSDRTGAGVVVQLDEPTLPRVLAGDLPTPSGYGNVAAVPAPEAERVLSDVIERIGEATGSPVIVHCCAARPPVGLLHRAGAGSLALDLTVLDEESGTLADELGQAWDAGVVMLMGLVPNIEPIQAAEIREYAAPAQRLIDRLGFDRAILSRQGVPTPTCGLSGTTVRWARRALGLGVRLAEMFHEDAEQ